MDVRPYLLADHAEDDIKIWLTHGFRTADWRPVVFSDLRSSPEAQIHAAFETIPSASQERLRGGVVRSIGEWSPAHPELLDSLCVLAAYIKATRTAPLLKTLVTTKLVERCDIPVFGDLTAKVIAALIGFAPLPDAASAVESLYFSDHVPPRYAAQLLNGMVRIDPKNVHRYLPRFVRIAYPNRNAGLFRLDIVLNRLVDEVTPTVLQENRKFMDRGTNQLLDLLLAEAGILLMNDEVLEDEVDAVRRVNWRHAQDAAQITNLDVLFGAPN
jgi:hypothetical protein